MSYKIIRDRVTLRGQQSATIRHIGHAIKTAAEDLRFRNLAASLATTAPPKDYLGQARAIYNDFTRRWRYVRDPAHKELVTYSPDAVWNLVLAGDGKGVGLGKGAGDCDCATVAIGALFQSVGFPVRIATSADRGAPPGRMFGHVFAQVDVPRVGWVTVDPVLYPGKPFGAIANASRLGIWNLDGQMIKTYGNFTTNRYGGTEMPEYQEYDGFFGSVEDGQMIQDWERAGLQGFGSLCDSMGYIADGGNLPPVEVTPDMYGLARTPMLEVRPEDYQYMQVAGRPYDSMLALGDDGEVYLYDGTLGRGFFRKLFRKVKKRVKKVAGRIKRMAKKIIKKIPGGKALLKISGKIRKIAMKVVRPLSKFVGKYAAKLAPIAALVPGWGTAIAAGLATAGKVANLMNKYGVKVMGKKGTVRRLHGKPSNIIGLKRDLNRAAAQMARRRRAA